MSALRSLSESTLADWWGPERAAWLWRRCRGIDNSPVTGHEGARSVSSESTFSRNVTTDPELERSLMEQVVDVGRSLRKHGLYARTVTVKLRDPEFRDRSRSRTLTEAVQTDPVIFSIARDLLHALRRQRSGPVRLIGVAVTNLRTTRDEDQHSLLEMAPPLERDRDRTLAQAVDHIRSQHGGVIGPGSTIRSPRPDS